MINHDETPHLHKGGVSAAGVAAVCAAGLGPPGQRGGIITGAPSPHQLSRQGSSVESHASSVPIHYHTAECSATGRSLHQPTHHSKVGDQSHIKQSICLSSDCSSAASQLIFNFVLQRGSPTSNECDFHCCALHAGHLSHKSVATSPIQPMGAVGSGGQQGSPALPTCTTITVGEDVTADGKRSLPKGAHVRFSHVEVDGSAAAQAAAGGNYDMHTIIEFVRHYITQIHICSNCNTFMIQRSTVFHCQPPNHNCQYNFHCQWCSHDNLFIHNWNNMPYDHGFSQHLESI